jgi:hypothetical protein
MTDFVVSDPRTTTFNLAAGDSLLLTDDGSIVPMSGFGIFGSGSNAATIAGDIITRNGTGIILGAATGGAQTLSVLGTGLVMGSSSGVNTTGSVNLTNAGDIIGFGSGSTGVSVGGGVGVISNSGVISGDLYGIVTNALGSPGFDITNTGLVQSGGVGMFVTPDSNIVRNFGTIDAVGIAVQMAGSRFLTSNTIINWGDVTSRTSTGISTSNGNDVIINRGSIIAASAGVLAGAGDDVFDNSFGGTVSGAINIGDGDDVVISGLGAENIVGGNGSDTVSYVNSPRAMLINLTDQVTTDGVATDTLSGIENAVGSASNDALYGDGGNNVLDGGPGGSDQIFGGGGSDTVSYASAVRAMLINLAGQVTVDGVDTDSLSSIENAIGSRFNDSIYGNDGDNVLDGGADGSDQIFGGLGSDTVSYATSARAVLINLPGQITTDGINNDTLSSIENATGSQFSDHIFGTAAGNTLNGGAGYDTINGGLGNDVINGGRGNDVMDGGADNDIFFFENASFPTSLADLYSGNDTINGFEKIAGAAGDQLQLQTPSSGIWSAAEAAGNTVFTLNVFGGAVATVTVTGVVGMVNGDDYLLV